MERLDNSNVRCFANHTTEEFNFNIRQSFALYSLQELKETEGMDAPL